MVICGKGSVSRLAAKLCGKWWTFDTGRFPDERILQDATRRLNRTVLWCVPVSGSPANNH
jgi:hypothetical protein